MCYMTISGLVLFNFLLLTSSLVAAVAAGAKTVCSLSGKSHNSAPLERISKLRQHNTTQHGTRKRCCCVWGYFSIPASQNWSCECVVLKLIHRLAAFFFFCPQWLTDRHVNLNSFNTAYFSQPNANSRVTQNGGAPSEPVEVVKFCVFLQSHLHCHWWLMYLLTFAALPGLISWRSCVLLRSRIQSWRNSFVLLKF